MTLGCPSSPGRPFRAESGNSGRQNRSKHRVWSEEFLLLSRHHVPHVPVRFCRPMYGHIAQSSVSSVRSKGKEITPGVQQPGDVYHMEVKFTTQFMPTYLA